MEIVNFRPISVVDAARIMGCTTGYVRYLCREGKLRSAKLGPRTRVVSQTDAQKLAEPPPGPGRPRGPASPE